MIAIDCFSFFVVVFLVVFLLERRKVNLTLSKGKKGGSCPCNVLQHVPRYNGGRGDKVPDNVAAERQPLPRSLWEEQGLVMPGLHRRCESPKLASLQARGRDKEGRARRWVPGTRLTGSLPSRRRAVGKALWSHKIKKRVSAVGDVEMQISTDANRTDK